MKPIHLLPFILIPASSFTLHPNLQDGLYFIAVPQEDKHSTNNNNNKIKKGNNDSKALTPLPPTPTTPPALFRRSKSKNKHKHKLQNTDDLGSEDWDVIEDEYIAPPDPETALDPLYWAPPSPIPRIDQLLGVYEDNGILPVNISDSDCQYNVPHLRRLDFLQARAGLVDFCETYLLPGRHRHLAFAKQGPVVVYVCNFAAEATACSPRELTYIEQNFLDPECGELGPGWAASYAVTKMYGRAFMGMEICPQIMSNESSWRGIDETDIKDTGFHKITDTPLELERQGKMGEEQEGDLPRNRDSHG